MKIYVNEMPDNPSKCPYAVKHNETYVCKWFACHSVHICHIDKWSKDCKYFKEWKK